MTVSIKNIITACTFTLVSGFVSADKQLIHAGQLLAIPGEAPRLEQSVLIEDDKILWIKNGFVEVNDAKLIDLKNSFVMPGLMDMHVHLQFELGPDNDKEALKMSDELMAMRSTHYALKTLQAGFTTVRDLGSNPQYMYALRDSIERGWVDGPRIIAAGGVGITGGHTDVSGMRHDLMEYYTTKQICDGPYDCRRAARQAIKYGGDLIKIASTGGVLTDRATGTGQQMTNDELIEVVSAAKSMGKKVAAHAHQEDGIVAALEAGVASIEHGSYAGPKAVKLFKKTGAYLVPTLLAGETVKRLAMESNFMSPEIKAKAIRVGGDMQSNFAKASKAGVKVAFGTDSGVSQHGINAQEAVLMHQAGMSEMDILVSATVNAADLIDRSKTLGTIESGKHADIIAMDNSPLENIEELLDVDFVMKGGTIYKY
ncbi:metal-dependent hydrolase family protein [Sessilibacter corallicola]|uniref:metal-dependent hydrolase family protein n=1 Tax=Sessilibacter corallicola TaxID=2904075 RepID=UPI001E2E5A27|nr:amidohydrolase family protein [Sessilibacter corallicola]MCE2030469.1 amidohydrolase family protein [Sessilibacter corallicola]